MNKEELSEHLKHIENMVKHINSGNISHQVPNTVFVIQMLIDKVKDE